MAYSFTRPAKTSEQDVKDISDEMENRRRRDRQHPMMFNSEPRFNHFLGWVAAIDPILEKPANQWTPEEKSTLGDAFHWALCNLT
jgi:hypothetical protein